MIKKGGNWAELLLKSSGLQQEEVAEQTLPAGRVLAKRSIFHVETTSE